MTWLLILVPLGALLLLRRHFVGVRVQGDSMTPTYADGELILVRRTSRFDRGGPRVGRVVVLMHHEEKLIKRVAAVAGDPVPAGLPVHETVVPPGRLVVLGDSPNRTFDSRSFGFVRRQDVLGVALKQR